VAKSTKNVVSLDRLFAQAPAATDLWPPFEHVVDRARRRPPANPEGTAHSYAQWVYHLYNGQRPPGHAPDEEEESRVSMYLGRWGEAYVDRFRSWLNKRFPSSMSGGWRPLYLATKDNRNRIFRASRLLVHGQPLRCRPDVVLKHEHTNDIVVVEIKVTGVPLPKIPPQGWQNLRAQLWCYAWIDEWISAKNVLLVGQFWPRPQFRAGAPFTFLPIYPRWRRQNRDFERECSELFRLYGGTIADVGKVAPDSGSQGDAPQAARA